MYDVLTSSCNLVLCSLLVLGRRSSYIQFVLIHSGVIARGTIRTKAGVLRCKLRRTNITSSLLVFIPMPSETVSLVPNVFPRLVSGFGQTLA